MIVVIDYGMGNIGSVLNMFKRIDVQNIAVSNRPEIVQKADKILLPGVGAFDTGMDHLRGSNLVEVLNEKALKQQVPVLGICLGMQLLTRSSEEGTLHGLGWIDAETKRFEFSEATRLKIPHMGWNYIKVKKHNPLIDLEEKHRFYFVHSYYVKCYNESDILGEAVYGIPFTCMVQHDNIFGAQFHPEKSHKFGMKLFQKFAAL